MGWLGDTLGFIASPLTLGPAILGKKAIDAASAPAPAVPKPIAAPKLDPRYQTLLQGQQQMAKTFRNNIPRVAESFMGQIAEVNKKSLANELDQTQKSYNKRGLLYSTARLGAEGAAQTRSAQDLNQKRSQINSQLYDEANALDQQAVDTGLNLASHGADIAKADTGLQNDYLDAALKKQQQDMAGLTGIGKGLGGGLGYLGGYLSGKKPDGLGAYETTGQNTLPASQNYLQS